PDAYEIFHAGRVPVREPNTAVACGAANCLWIIRAVNTDPWSIQAHPKNADQVVRARREIVIILRAHSVVEHALVVPKPRPDRCTQNFPCADRRRQSFGSWGDREHADQLVAIEDFKQVLMGIDENLARSECGILGNFSFGEFFDFERQDIRNLESFAWLKI